MWTPTTVGRGTTTETLAEAPEAAVKMKVTVASAVKVDPSAT
eukprot:CAMPEP_0174872766 /NCGR_PEP_ID=MMETSP1114-20130205/73813_1 /TAXON_ID=312471 /ORGANISM="Neobodo designis, Strain CCAP 1951/1" /LENGTH=41 /DNA_ID= /DNA_START= /DNA_END= /DNA_ORIENTATION=